MSEGNWKDTFRKAYETTGQLYERFSFILSLLITIIGFIVLSYVIQDDKCFLYDDWRRVFTLISFVILAILSSIGLIIYALSVKMSDTTGKFGSVFIRLLILTIGGFVISLMYLPTINLMWKSRASFEMVEAGADTKHPKQKNWSIVIASLIIYGSLIPFGKEIGNVIIGQSLVDLKETNELIETIRIPVS